MGDINKGGVGGREKKEEEEEESACSASSGFVFICERIRNIFKQPSTGLGHTHLEHSPSNLAPQLNSDTLANNNKGLPISNVFKSVKLIMVQLQLRRESKLINHQKVGDTNPAPSECVLVQDTPPILPRTHVSGCWLMVSGAVWRRLAARIPSG